VLDLERPTFAVGSVGLDEEFPGLAEEARAHAVMLKAGVVEIAEHRFVGGVVHRLFVLRCAPQRRLVAMAAGAGLAADEGCRSDAGRARERSAPEPLSEADGDDQNGSEQCGDPEPALRWRGGDRGNWLRSLRRSLRRRARARSCAALLAGFGLFTRH